MARLDEGRVKADGFADLLLHQIVAIAPDLEVVLNLGFDCDDGLANRHDWLACLLIDARVHIKLVEYEDFFVVLALEHAEE